MTSPAASAPDDAAAREQLLAAYVGRNWESHYRKRFASFEAGGGPWAWNWAAALVPGWLAYRRRPGAQVLSFVLFWAIFIAGALMGGVGDPFQDLYLVYLVLCAVQGLVGDRLVYAGAVAAANLASRMGRGGAEAVAHVRRRGGGSAVTFLLLVVLPVAFVVFKVLPMLNPRPYVAMAAMKSDLRNLVTAEESYFADNVTYSRHLSMIVPTPFDSTRRGPMFVPSEGVRVFLGTVTGKGWNATAQYRGASMTCSIFVGDAPRPDPRANEGEPVCR